MSQVRIAQPELAQFATDLAVQIEERAQELIEADNPSALGTNITARMAYTQARCEATYGDPLAFALVYLIKHLRSADGLVSLGKPHMAWSNKAELMLSQQRPDRIAYIAPRDCGKSTWWFLIIPMWAAAHGHSKFIAAFADSGMQAETHLMSFKHELDTNEQLRLDFPTLCAPMKRESTGSAVADNRSLYVASSGFAFKAAGIDASNLGLKVNETRPDFIIFDDIEPDESSYSAYQAKKRLSTVLDAVLPMNTKARVVFCGTVTMPGCIMHQLVNSKTTKGDPAQWITDEKIKVHYQPPMVKVGDKEQSCWPEKWPMDYLKGIEHTRSYAKNFKNQPLAGDGDYWNEEDFSYIEKRDADTAPITHTMLSLDPAVTTKRTSDYTGIAVISYKPAMAKMKPRGKAERDYLHTVGSASPLPAGPVCIVWEALAVKMTGAGIRQKCLDMIEESEDTAHPIRMIYVETNQGGDLWLNALHDMPVPIKVIHNSINKDVRAAQTLNHYQRDRVWHVGELIAAEQQMAAYPNSINDDIVDAIGNGVAYYAKRANHKQQDAPPKSVSYVN